MLRIEKIEGKAYYKPTKSYKGDAGWDVRTTERKVLQPGEVHRFMLGFRIIGESGKVYLVEDRSSLALRGLIVTGRVIDRGYMGEVSVIMHNTNSVGEEFFMEGDKIAQILVIPVDEDNLLIDQGDEFAPELPYRDDKGTGSSGK